MTLLVEIPMVLPSVANLREHWRVRAKRAADHRWVAAHYLRGAARPVGMRPTGQCLVTLTRIAPRQLDDDNLRAAFKAVRDGVADWLGVADNSPRVAWRYEQARGKPRTHAVQINVEEVSDVR